MENMRMGKDFDVTDNNIHQVVRALYAIADNNYERINKMEPVLNTMARKVDRLNTMLVENGYAKAVHDSTAEIKELRAYFHEYVKTREQTCPVAKRDRLFEDKLICKRNRTATLVKLVFAGIGAVSTIIVIMQAVNQVL